MQAGTPLERTRKAVNQIEAGLAATNLGFKPDQRDGLDLVETTYVRFSENQEAKETGPHVATIQVDLLSNELRSGRIADILRVWREEVGVIADAQSLSFDEPQLGPGGRPIEIELSGLPLATLDRISAEIQKHLQTFDGVYSITDDTRRGQREVLVKLRPGAVGLEITARDLGRQLRGSFQGLLSDQIQIRGEGYDVEVRFAESDRASLADLEDFRVSLPGGNRRQ